MKQPGVMRMTLPFWCGSTVDSE